jgi:DNA-directed RNA polymerase specialized sigma24 family protein
MSRTMTPAGRPEFLEELLAVRDDPKVESFALALARDPELARDALDETYCAVARVRNPECIEDLRAYFCRTLRRVVNKLRNQLGATLVEDFGRVAEAHQDTPGCHPLPPPPIAETVSSGLLAQNWLEPFAADPEELASRVASRSPRPVHYQGVIVAVSGRVLVAIVTGDVCDADSNAALCADYPEWFAEPGCTENTLHQRLSRARADVRALLRTIISRRDLYR